MENRSPDMLKPTLIAGLVFGTLGAIPFFNLLNCACCALIVACGFFASYLFSGDCRRRGAEFRAGTGALVGLIAGAFYALVNSLVGAVIQLTVGDLAGRRVLEWLQALPNLPPESAAAIESALERSGSFSVFTMVIGFFLTLLLGAIFATVGGLIGGAVFKVARPEPPPAPPSPPPSVGGDYAPPPGPMI